MRVTPRTLVSLGAITLALGNMGRIPIGNLGGRAAPVSIGDLVLIPLWLTLAIVVTRRLRRWPLDGTTRWTLAFIFLATVSLAHASQLWGLGVAGTMGPAAFLLRWVLYAGWFWLVTVCFSTDDSYAGVASIEWALLAVATFGIVQSAFLPNFAQVVPWGGENMQWDVQGRRLVSTLLDPNLAGILVVIALLLELAREAESLPARRGRLVTLAVAVLLTLSRSSMLALIVGVMVLISARGVRRRLAGVLLAGSVALVPFLVLLLRFAASFNKLKLDGSALQRLVPWTRALTMISDHPLLGVGFNAVPAAQVAYGFKVIGGADVSLDGGLLFIATMTGIPGALLYTGMITSTLLTCRMIWRRADEPRARALAAGTAAASIAVLVHSLFVNSLLLPFIMQVLWLLWGAVIVVARPLRAAQGASPATGSASVSTMPLTARSAAQGASLVLTVLLLGSCEPCGGAVMCSTPPTFALSGQIVEPVTGAPVRGAVVRVKDVQSVTESNGRWELALPAVAGVTEVDVTVKSPVHPAYTVHGVPVHPQTRRGEVQELGRWNDHPFARYQGTLERRGQPLGFASVSFTPSGGVTATTLATVTANSGGIFTMFLEGDTALGVATGTLTIAHSSLARPSRFQGFAIPLTHLWELPVPAGPFQVGPRMDYAGTVHFRGNDTPVGGARITFTRTGGVELDQSMVQTQADAGGFFVLLLVPRADGSVIGTLAIETADRRHRSQYVGVNFASYDSTSLGFSGGWAIGESLAYALEFWRNDSSRPAPGVPVQLTRVSGVAISPEVLSTRTDQTGRIEWRPTVLDTGTVTLDIVVSPEGFPSRTIRNVRFRTFDNDSLRFGGVIGYGTSMRYGGVARFRGTDTGAPQARLTFTRTGGVELEQSVVQTQADATGFYVLPLVARTDGLVKGDLLIETSDTRQRSTYRNLSFSSYDSTALRSMGGLGIGERWAYAFEIWRNDTRLPAPNVQVELRRVDGLSVAPSSLTTRTDQGGWLQWRPAVQDTGTVELELIVSPANEPSRTIRNVKLRTYESDTLRSAGIFGFGAALHYIIEVRGPDDRLIQGATVTWTQTGGSSASPRTVTATTASTGWMVMDLIPSADGEVTGDLTVVPPAPWPAGTVFTVPNVRLATQQDLHWRVAITYRLPPP